jgi:oligopeptidase B
MVTSRDDSPNFKIVYAREEMVLHAGKAFNDWQTLLPHDPHAQILDLDIFESHLVVFENAYEFERQQQLRIIDLKKGLEKADTDRKNHIILHFPELTQITPGLNKNFVQDSFNFMYSSIILPVRECVYDFNSKLTPAQARGQPPSSLYSQRQHESLSPWDYMWPYHMHRDTYTSHDGVQVPITICQKRDLFVEEVTEWEPMSNTARFCLLYVYGSYGEVPSLHFQPLPYMWMMRRRWTVAFAHIRGGGEKGSEWARAGKGHNKMNGVLDFVHACKHLVNQGFTVPSRLVVVGNSAGTVPIAAAMNMHGRDLFHMALLRSPFLDVIGTMMNPELPLSLSEREDWGDPLHNSSDLDYLKTYDPYYNIRDDIDYPSMVISAAMDDDRVPAWNALKYAARMREQRRRRNVDPLRWSLHTRFPPAGGHYYFNQIQQICEELILIINHLSLPSTYYKEQDMDAMQQMHNGFKTGMMDHDDQQTTFLKWENWEREKIDYVQKLHTQEYEPNFRVLRARKQPFYWTATHDDGSLREKAEKLAEQGVPPPAEKAVLRERDHTNI